MKNLKLYVVVREDLSPSYRAVQAGHAVAEFLLRGPTSIWTNGILVYLGVNDERELRWWSDRLTHKNIDWVGFEEPDIGNQLTAVASLGNDKIFKRLKLMK